jgi:hypothetical protein
LEDLGVNRNIKMDKEIRQKYVDYSHLAQNRNKWQFLVSTIIKLTAP